MSGLGRRITAPLRNYFNGHFELVKTEVRATAADEGRQTRQAVAELGEVVGALSDRIAELERVVDRLGDVLAALTLVPEPGGQSGN